MVTKRTRLMSALLAILMVVSMLTAFVLPASAETGTALVDGKGDLPNIADGLKDGKTEYQVNSRAGLEKMASIMGTTASTTFSDVTFWQTADIDMGWEPFTGIAGYNSATTSFQGTFDGNGFVIKNLFIIGRQQASYKDANNSVVTVGIGLFNQASNATFRNVGIASGLVAGRNAVGSIVGYGDASLKMINCWNAATIVYAAAGDGSAGLVGGLRGSGSPSIINSYNLGLITGYHGNGSQITGWIGGAVSLTMKNSYGAGHIVSGWKTTYVEVPTNGEALGYHGMIRANSTSNKSTGSNNYYVDNGSGLKSYQDANAAGYKVGDAAIKNLDGAAAVTEAALADGTLVEKLNSGDVNAGDGTGYSVKYVQSDKGYPVLQYTKTDGTTIVRTAEDTVNVACNTWAEKSALFAAITAGKNGGLNTTALGDIHIKDADDFFAYAFLTMSGTGFFTNKTYLDADIDMADQEMMPGLKYIVPLFWAQQFTGTFDGGDHKIDNLYIKVIDPKLSSNGNSYLYYEQMGLFNYITTGVVKNLNLASGIIEMINETGGERFLGGLSGRYLKGTIYKCQVGLTVKLTTAHSDSCVSGFVRMDDTAGKIDSCIFTGALITNGAHASAFSDWHSGGWIRNSFAAGAPANNNEGYLQGIYRHGNSTKLANTYTTSLLVDNTLGSGNAVSYKDATRVLDSEAYSSGELAWKLNSNWNNDAGLAQVYYTVDGGKTIFGTVENQTRKLTYKNGEDTYSVYVNAGTKVTLDHPGLINETFGTLSDGTVENGVLTMPASDVTVEITDYTGLDLTDLVAAIEKWEDRNASYYAEVDGAKLTDTLAAAKAGYAATMSGATGAYTDQNAINAAVVALEAFEGKYGTYPNIPRASEYAEYSDAKNFLLKDEHDLAYAKVYYNKFTADVTMELANDIAVSSNNIRANDMSGVQASIDGHEFAIKNVTFSGKNAWLGTYGGESIKNLTLDGWKATNMNWQGALLVFTPGSTELLIENVKLKNCTGVSGDSTGSSLLVGVVDNADAVVTLKNITLEGCTLEQPYSKENNGMVVGKLRKGTVNIDGLIMRGNKTNLKNSGGSGLVFGEMTGTANVKNVIVEDTTHIDSVAISGTIVGAFKKSTEDTDTTATLTLENILSVDNGNYPLVADTVDGDAASSTITYGNAVFTDADKIASGYESEKANTITAEELDALYAAGGVAAKFNSNTETYLWTMEDGEIAYGDETNAIRTVAVVKDFGSGTESIETYLKVGEKYTVSEIANYSLKEDSGYTIGQEITVANQDYAIGYTLTGVETKPAEDIVADLGRYDMNLFVNNGTDMAAVLAEAKAALEQAAKDSAKIKEANDAIQAVWAKYEANVTDEDRVLKGEYPYLPGYADIDIYKDLEGYDPNNLAISDRADWIAAVAEGAKTFEGITLHLTDHINMNNDATGVTPLSFGTGFKGTLDGHNFTFKNMKMEFTTNTKQQDVGLVGKVSGGVVKNLGIANGTMKFDYAATKEDDIGFGAIVGRLESGKILHCWNAADVTVTASGGVTAASVGGIAGRGLNGTVIDGCYNVGTITGPSHVAGINDWAQSNGHIYNSFNAGVLKAGNGNASLVRHNDTTATSGVHSNIYALGSKLVGDANATIQAAYNVAPYSNMDTDAYASGELAWYLNSGYDENYGEKTYWTIEDGKTVYGTAGNQTVRVLLDFATREEDEAVYLNLDDETVELAITYGEAEGNNKPIFTVAEGYKSTIADDGKTLNYADEGDIVVNVTFGGDGIDYINLLKAYEVWGGRNSDYYKANANGRTLATVVSEAMTKYNDQSFVDQDEVEAYVAEANAFAGQYAGYPNLPLASEFETYPDAPGYLIKTKADMEVVQKYSGNASGDFTADQTLYLMNNLDMTDSSFTGTTQLRASIEGNDYTISNMNFTGVGMFFQYRGASIKNLKIANSTINSTDVYRPAFLVGNYYGTDLTIDNVHISGCKFVNNTTVKSSGSNSAGSAFFVSRNNASNTTITVTNSGIDNCEHDSNNKSSNTGLIFGQTQFDNTVYTAKNIYVTNNVISNVTAGTGLFAGCAEAGVTMNATNIVITGNKITGKNLGWDNNSPFIAAVKSSSTSDIDTELYASQIVAMGNTTEFEVNDTKNGTTASVMNNNPATQYLAELELTDFYTDRTRVFQNVVNTPDYDNSGEHAQQTTADLPGIAYLLNSTSGEEDYKWKITETGTIALAEEGDALPKKVTFKTNDAEYAHTALDVTLYTDVNGKLIGFDAVEDEIRAAGPWTEAEIAEWSGTYSADRDYTVNPYPAHDDSHELEAVQVAGSTNTHTLVCTHKVDGVACQYKETDVACTFVDTCVDKTAEPGEAKHYGLCACGNKTAEVLCKDDGMEKVTVESTLDTNGTDTYTCVCGYEHVDTLPLRVGLDTDADKAYVGEEVTITVSLKNALALDGAVVDITYDHSKMLLKGAKLLAPNCNPQVSLNVKSEETGVATDCIAFTIGYDYEGAELMELTFAVPAGTEEGKTDLKIDMRDISTHDLEDYDVEAYEGQVEILDLIRGDMDGDRTVTIADAIVMLRYVNENAEDLYAKFPNMEPLAGDVDRNGKVELIDVVYVLQYLNHYRANLIIQNA